MSVLVSDKSLCQELAFCKICDDLLQSALHSSLQASHVKIFEDLEFNPFLIDDGK